MQKLLVRGLFLALFFSAAESWALPTCPDTDDSTWTNCVGTKTFASGNQYVGEWKDGEFHGQGTKTYADGRIEEGIWEKDEFLYAQKITPKNAPPEAAPSAIANDGNPSLQRQAPVLQ